MSLNHPISSNTRFPGNTTPYADVSQRGYASDTDLIGVLGFLPQEGEVGCPITVHVQFTDHWNQRHKVSVRLVVFDKPIATQVTPDANGTWTLDASIPYLPPETLSSLKNKVPMSVQVLDSDSQIVLDQLTFGEFTYWTSERPPFQVSKALAILERNETVAPAPQIPSNFDPEARRGSVPSLPSASSVIQRTQLERRSRGRSMIASRTTATEDESLSQKIKLEIVTPLHTMCESWTYSEQQAGRRLVKIRKLQMGSKIVLSMEPFAQQDYSPESDSSAHDCIISCIFYADTQKYYVTSVDVIYLLQRITNHPGSFPTDEKNRIRRNMEALRPTVVAKTKGCEGLFSLIMNFPDPKPRNIEKDIKVFDWMQLGQALDRVLSKYSLYAISPLSALPGGDQDTAAASSSSSSRMDDTPVSLPSQSEIGPAPYVDQTPLVAGMKNELHEPSFSEDGIITGSPIADVVFGGTPTFMMEDKQATFVSHPMPPSMSPSTSGESLLGSDGWPPSYGRPMYRFPQYPGGNASPTSPNMQLEAGPPGPDGFDSWGSAIH